MDFTNNPQQNPGNRLQPNQPGQPVRRPVFNDFAPRPHSAPTTQPAASTRPVPVTVAPPSNQIVTSQSPAAEQDPAAALHVELDDDDQAASKPVASKEKDQTGPHETAHSGLVGLVLFAILCVLALAPFLPGKIVQNFPASSETTSSGEQTIGCASDLGPIHTATTYNYKRGFPVIYGYQTTSTIQATCEGVNKTATGGQTSQFNPWGGLLDVIAAGVSAIIIAKIWRRLFSPKY